jgi:hypothetical protein
VVTATDPHGRILGFLDRSRYFSIKQLLNCTQEAEWTPFQTHCFSEIIMIMIMMMMMIIIIIIDCTTILLTLGRRGSHSF